MFDAHLAWFGFNAPGAILLALISSTTFAQTIYDAWTEQVASVEEIAAYYSDGDELDNAARQYVAYETIWRGIEEILGERIYSGQITASERAVWDAFRDAKNDTDLAMHSKYQQADNEKYQDFLQRRADFRSDRKNLDDVIARFAPPIYKVMQPIIAEQARWQAKRLDNNLRYSLWAAFWGFLGLTFFYLLFGSLRDKFTKYGVAVEASDDMTVITYKPGKHGPIAALSIYPLYINIVLFMATLSVGFIFMFAAAERSEWFQDLMRTPQPAFLDILMYKAFWVGLGLMIMIAPWWLLAIANFRRRRKRKIAVTRDAVTVGRKTYMLNDLRSFYSWGYGDGSARQGDTQSDVIVVGGNAAGRAAASGAMHGAAIRQSANLFKRKVGRVGNQVIGEFGERKEVLAKWLPKARALIVTDEIDKAIRRHRTEDSGTGE